MATSQSGPGPEPIYDSLVAELGDVLTQARQTAETTQRQASGALDWSDLHTARANPGPTG